MARDWTKSFNVLFNKIYFGRKRSEQQP